MERLDDLAEYVVYGTGVAEVLCKFRLSRGRQRSINTRLSGHEVTTTHLEVLHLNFVLQGTPTSRCEGSVETTAGERDGERGVLEATREGERTSWAHN